MERNKNLYFAFIDLEKALNRVPRKVLWWVMSVVGVPEWNFIVQAMYSGANRMYGSYNGSRLEFEVKAGVHQGSVLISFMKEAVIK